jgi:hypothetical protein
MCDEDSVLKQNGDHEFTLKEGHDTVWITVNNISVYIRKTPSPAKGEDHDGIMVKIYPKKCEDRHYLSSIGATFDEAADVQCRKCGLYNGGGDGFDGMCPSCADKDEEQREMLEGLSKGEDVKEE